MESDKEENVEVVQQQQSVNAPQSQTRPEVEGDVFYDAVEEERPVPAPKNDQPDPDAIEVADQEQMPETGNKMN